MILIGIKKYVERNRFMVSCNLIFDFLKSDYLCYFFIFIIVFVIKFI